MLHPENVRAFPFIGSFHWLLEQKKGSIFFAMMYTPSGTTGPLWQK
jgi:hypothetical protein